VPFAPPASAVAFAVARRRRRLLLARRRERASTSCRSIRVPRSRQRGRRQRCGWTPQARRRDALYAPRRSCRRARRRPHDRAQSAGPLHACSVRRHRRVTALVAAAPCRHPGNRPGRPRRSPCRPRRAARNAWRRLVLVVSIFRRVDGGLRNRLHPAIARGGACAISSCIQDVVPGDAALRGFRPIRGSICQVIARGRRAARPTAATSSSGRTSGGASATRTGARSRSSR
jgi:hypothetical protein